MSDYSKGKIYQIKNTMNDLVYVGSTANTLERRMAKHKQDMKKEGVKHRKLYSLMNEIGADKFFVELIEDYPCASKLELLAREGFYVRERGTLNKLIPGRTAHEYKHKWHKENIERIHEAKKEYYQQHRDYTLNKAKQYYAENKQQRQEARNIKIICDKCGCEVSYSNKTRHQKTLTCQQAASTESHSTSGSTGET